MQRTNQGIPQHRHGIALQSAAGSTVAQRRLLRDEKIKMLNEEETSALRSVVLAGHGAATDTLAHLEEKTGLVVRVFRGHYEVNGTMREVLEEWARA